VPRTVEGNLLDVSGRYAIVAARFNDFITSRLVEGALHAFARHGVDTADLPVIWVPGAYELPLVCQKLAASGKYAAVIALGCVIRGGTPHFDYVAGEAAKGVAAAPGRRACPSSSVCLLPTASSRRSSEPGPRWATRVGKLRWPPWRW